MTTRRIVILIVGATGRQGSAVVAQLCALPDSRSEIRILALTRRPESDKACELQRRFPQIELHRGDVDNLGALFDSLPATPDAIFSVQPALGKGYSPQKEIQQGQKLHEAAIDVGVRHIVYSSVDRHGVNSDTTATKVPHFDSKWEIEQHLTAECARASSLTSWTILRPTTFFDNLTDDLAGRVVAATIGQCPRPQQMVAVRDVGWFAARALTGYTDVRGWRTREPSPNRAPPRDAPKSRLKSNQDKNHSRDPSRSTRSAASRTGSRTRSPGTVRNASGRDIDVGSSNPYAFRKISLAGDCVDLAAMRSRFYEKMGYALPEAYSWLGSGALWLAGDMGAMYRWLGRVGYNADVAACRIEHPGMLRFADWLQTESSFTRGGEVLGGWLQ